MGDPLTRVGRLLRKTKIDEFPQLINALHGEMSVVVPRPEMRYTHFIIGRDHAGPGQNANAKSFYDP